MNKATERLLAAILVVLAISALNLLFAKNYLRDIADQSAQSCSVPVE